MKGRGIVISLKGNKAKVNVTSGAECMECPSRSNCHGSPPKNREIVVINDYGAHVSDTVVFEADTGKVILSATLVWIIPVLAMVAGYAVTHRFAGGIWPIGAAFLFLAGSFLILKLIDTAVSGGTSFYPRITKILDTSDSGL